MKVAAVARIKNKTEPLLRLTVYSRNMIEETCDKRGLEVDVIYELSKILDVGLDRKVLALVMELIEYGVNPESIADSKFENITFYFI